MELTEFYSAVAQLSFTLFGVWFVVVELGPEVLLGDRVLRRTTFHVSLGFLLPGILSLGSLLAVESLVMWRIAFGIGGLAGALTNVRFASSDAAAAGPVPTPTWWISAVVYTLVAVVAMFRPTLHLPGEITLPPLTQEGVLVSLLMLIGSFSAWRVFAMPALVPDEPS